MLNDDLSRVMVHESRLLFGWLVCYGKCFSILYNVHIQHIVWPLWIVMLSERFFVHLFFSQFWHNNFAQFCIKWMPHCILAYISPALPVATEEVPHQMQMFGIRNAHCILHMLPAIPPFRMECICWMVCSLLFCTHHILYTYVLYFFVW